jgi:hypothetical protein
MKTTGLSIESLLTEWRVVIVDFPTSGSGATATPCQRRLTYSAESVAATSAEVGSLVEDVGGGNKAIVGG